MMVRKPMAGGGRNRGENKAVAETRRKALRTALQEHGLRSSELARLAGLPSANGLYNYLGGRSRSLKTATWALLLPHLPRSDPQILMGLVQQTATPYENDNDPALTGSTFTKQQEFVFQLIVVHLIELKDDLHHLQQKINEWTFRTEGLEGWLTSLADEFPPETRRMLRSMRKCKSSPVRSNVHDAEPE